VPLAVGRARASPRTPYERAQLMAGRRPGALGRQCARDCFDRVIALDDAHVRRLALEYLLPRVGGLHHRYTWKAAA
jgi:hypothetical protein